MVTPVDRPAPRSRVISSRLVLRAFAAVALSAALAGSTHAQSIPPPIDLGTIGDCCSFAYGINDAGAVVGRSRTPTNTFLDNAFLWTAVDGMIDLGRLGAGTWSLAYDVNRAGHVVGASNTSDATASGWHGFLWTAAGGMEDLGSGSANAINNAGQVVGSNGDGFGCNGHAFLWTASGGMVDLGTLGGSSCAYDINDAGQVVGESYTASGAQRAFLWTAARGMIDLGTLGGPNSRAYGINNAGQVVGDSDGRAFLWTAANGMIDIGTLGGNSYASDINDAGHVVGASSTASGAGHAFLWTAARGMIDLGTFVGATVPISTAQAINNAGQVAGASYLASPLVYHAALWNVCIPGPPLIAGAAATPSVLWPPNHQMIPVRVDYTVTTRCGATATTALSVVSDEPGDGRGDGTSLEDAVVVDGHTVLLRAERAGPGDGRTYTIRITTTDSEGYVSIETRTVSVPKSMHK